MKHLLLLASLLAMPLSGTAQTEVTNYRPGITAEGATYFLPQTAIHVTLTTTRVHHEPGEYAMYAERFLRLKNVPLAPFDEWKIDDVELTTYGKANKQQAYSVKLRQKSSAAYISLASDGRLLAINAEAPEEETLSQPAVINSEKPKFNPADFKTEEILAAGSTLKMAELTANEIYDIRENRSLLSKGQADFMPKDGEQLRIMMENLQQQEEGLLALFKGTSRSETRTFTFDFIPTGETASHILLRFSKYFGPVDADDLSGIPIYLSVKDLHALPEAAPADPKVQKKHEEQDMRYIVAGRAKIRLHTSESTLADITVPMAQFGRVEYLGGELFNKKQMTSVTLSPQTGSILKIEAAEQQQ